MVSGKYVCKCKKNIGQFTTSSQNTLWYIFAESTNTYKKREAQVYQNFIGLLQFLARQTVAIAV